MSFVFNILIGIVAAVVGIFTLPGALALLCIVSGSISIGMGTIGLVFDDL